MLWICPQLLLWMKKFLMMTSDILNGALRQKVIFFICSVKWSGFWKCSHWELCRDRLLSLLGTKALLMSAHNEVSGPSAPSRRRRALWRALLQMNESYVTFIHSNQASHRRRRFMSKVSDLCFLIWMFSSAPARRRLALFGELNNRIRFTQWKRIKLSPHAKKTDFTFVFAWCDSAGGMFFSWQTQKCFLRFFFHTAQWSSMKGYVRKERTFSCDFAERVLASADKKFMQEWHAGKKPGNAAVSSNVISRCSFSVVSTQREGIIRTIAVALKAECTP